LDWVLDAIGTTARREDHGPDENPIQKTIGFQWLEIVETEIGRQRFEIVFETEIVESQIEIDQHQIAQLEQRRQRLETGQQIALAAERQIEQIKLAQIAIVEQRLVEQKLGGGRGPQRRR